MTEKHSSAPDRPATAGAERAPYVKPVLRRLGLLRRLTRFSF